MRTLLSILRADAKNWWYHAQLRDQGKVREAEKLERENVREAVKVFRKALASNGFLSCGYGGFTFHIDSSTFLTGYDRDGGAYGRACDILGIPVLDKNTVKTIDIHKGLSIPLPAMENAPEPKPWTGLSLAPTSEVLQRWVGIGATLRNHSLSTV